MSGTRTRTETYVVLEVEASTYDDVKERLAAVGELESYLHRDSDYEENLILFGSVALAKESES